MEAKIISMHGKGMTTGDMEAHVKDMYGIEISDSTISRITDKILPVVREWQARPLESVYAVLFMDAIHFHVRAEGQIVKKAVYVSIGIGLDGRRDVLGMWVGESESSKFWLSVMNGMRNRGVNDILIACIDGLSGFPAAISAAFPKTEIQQCIIHQIRNSTRSVSYKDIKPLMVDLRAVYGVPDEGVALAALDALDGKWGGKYPKIAESWRSRWPELSTYYKYPSEVRKLIYTTNAIEGFNRQLRKVTKSKSVFPTDDSLLKMLYLAMIDIMRKWTGRRQEWGLIHSQLMVFFGERAEGGAGIVSGTYSHVKISVAPELAAASRSACAARGASMAGEISRFMAKRAGAPESPATRPLGTRRQRRNELKELVGRRTLWRKPLAF